MAMHGTLAPFDASQEEWSSYVERVTHYFRANDVSDAAKKRSILLAVCGPATYKIIRSVFTTEEFATIWYKALVDKVTEHLEPTPSPIVQRYKFNSRVRAKGKTIATYLEALRELLQHCDYGDSLSEMLRYRLVCGVSHEGIQRRLLAEKDLTYDKAREIALAVEAAEQGTRDLKQASITPGAGSPAVKSCLYSHASMEKKGKSTPKVKPSPETKLICYRCGAGSHLAAACKFKEAICHACNKKGHLARVCRSKLRGEGAKEKLTKTNYMFASGRKDLYDLFTIRTPAEGPITLTLELNSVPVTMEVDSGAALSIINHATYLAISQQVLGVVETKACYQDGEHQITLQGVSGQCPNLLGRDWLTTVGVTLEGIIAHVAEAAEPLKGILDKHPAVFSDELGCRQGPLIHLPVDGEVKPIFCKPRTVPLALKAKVEAKLNRLEAQGIISPVKFSMWAAPIVPVLKRDRTVRICGDYKATINRARRTLSLASVGVADAALEPSAS